MNLKPLNRMRQKMLGLTTVLLYSLVFVSSVQAADVTVNCLDSGNCASLVYNNHDGKVTAVCDASATNSNLPVRITLNGDVYTGTLDCSGLPVDPPDTAGPWTVTGPGACTQECGGGTQFFTVTCEYDSCTGPRPPDSQDCNMQACENCDPDNWGGDDPASVCLGQLGTQTNECGDERNVTGTWDPQDWGPDPSLVCSFDTFYQGTSCGDSRQVSGTLDCQATWHWLRPATPEPLVSASAESDYNNIRVTGDIYYAGAGLGFFDVNTVRAARIAMINGPNEYEYAVPLSDITFTDRVYDFLLDMSEMQADTPAGAASPVSFVDGDWEIDVMFEYTNSEMPGYEWIRSGINGSLVMDSTPPAADFAHKEGGASSADTFAQDVLTNEPGYLWVNCNDSGPAGCLGDVANRDAGAVSDDYAPFAVKGNFCDNSSTCDTAGVNTFEVCDLADNCTNLEAIMDNYDPISPSALDFAMGLEAAGSFISTVLKASDSYYPSLEYVDPNEVSVSATESVVGGQAYITADSFASLFDDNACGDPASSPFILNSTQTACALQNKNYPPTCEDLASCPDPCPAGYVWDAGLSRCELSPDCTDTSWTPDVTIVCDAQSFTQVSNCGNRQNAIGTKDCSASSNWRTTPAPDCPTACGLPASTQEGMVTCPGSNCDPATEPDVPTRSCSATASCDPTYTGTWSTTPAPSCPTACDTVASTQAGTVTCSDSNCDPSTEPAEPTRSCGATATCDPIFTGTWNITAAPSCPTACGTAASVQRGAVTCSDNNCDPSTEPAEPTQNCGATAACTPVTTCTPFDWGFDGWCRKVGSREISQCNNFNLYDVICGSQPNCTIQNLVRVIDTCAVCEITADRCITTTPSAPATTPVYTGTWTQNPAPSCSTACGQSASTQTGTVTCSNSNCDPSTRPPAITRNCGATAACASGPTIPTRPGLPGPGDNLFDF